MVYTVSDIISTVTRNGFLPTNKFLVRFNSPINNGSLDRFMSFRAESARLPGITYLVSDVNRYGPGPLQKMPYNAAFTDVGITFLEDRNGIIYNYFHEWMNYIFNFSDNAYVTEYKENYETDIQVDIFDNEGNVVKTVTMTNAFPVALNEIPLDWNNQNTLMKINVTFTFREWYIE